MWSPEADLVGVYQETDCSTTVIQFQSEDFYGQDKEPINPGLTNSPYSLNDDRDDLPEVESFKGGGRESDVGSQTV